MMRHYYPVFVGTRGSVQSEQMEVVDHSANGAEQQANENVREEEEDSGVEQQPREVEQKVNNIDGVENEPQAAEPLRQFMDAGMIEVAQEEELPFQVDLAHPVMERSSISR